MGFLNLFSSLAYEVFRNETINLASDDHQNANYSGNIIENIQDKKVSELAVSDY